MQRQSSFTLSFVGSQRDFKIKTHQKTDSSPDPNPFYRNWKFWAIIVALVSTAIIAGLRYEDVVEHGKSGEPRIKTKRIRRLEDTVRYYDGAEQYGLFATKARYYPCPSCPAQDSIFLFPGEVWKYGSTINGQSGRYPNGLSNVYLEYRTQFVGSLPRCKSEEQIKIVNYPLLPENQKRDFKEKLARPPGNPYDN